MPQYLTEPMALLTAPSLSDPLSAWEVVYTVAGQQVAYDPGYMDAQKQSAQAGGTVAVHEKYAPSLQFTVLRSDLDSLARVHPTAIKGTDSIAFKNRSGVHTPRCWVLVPAASVDIDSTGTLTLAPFATMQWYVIQQGVAVAQPVTIKQVQGQGESTDGYQVTIEELATVDDYVAGRPYSAGLATMGLQVLLRGALPLDLGGIASFARGTTGTYLDDNGVVQTAAIDTPRYQEGRLLMEPQRTNYNTTSNTFTSWTKTSSGTGVEAIVTSNHATAPDGTNTASRIQITGNGSSNASYIRKVVSAADGDYTLALWMKSNTGANQNVLFDSLGVTANNVTVTPEWQRFVLPKSALTGTKGIDLGHRTGSNSTTQDFLIWEAGFENGVSATSTIPNSTGASLTRNQDVLTIPYSSLYNDTNGLTVAMRYHVPTALDPNTALLSLGSADNYVVITTDATLNKVRLQKAGGVITTFGTVDASLTETGYRIAGFQLGASLTNDGDVVNASGLSNATVDLATSDMDGEAWGGQTITLRGAGYELDSLVVMQGLPAFSDLQSLLGAS